VLRHAFTGDGAAALCPAMKSRRRVRGNDRGDIRVQMYGCRNCQHFFSISKVVCDSTGVHRPQMES
jgi:hypothetical protein